MTNSSERRMYKLVREVRHDLVMLDHQSNPHSIVKTIRVYSIFDITLNLD